MTVLTDTINQIVNLNEDEKNAIEKIFGTLTVSKGELWVRQGDICEQVAYVVSGKLRNFYVDLSGNEVTCYFVPPDSFISSFTSFLINTPTNENI